jgi:hypothetical protein
MKRVAYDADTARYTFRDRDGRVYVGPSGEDYGVLTLVSGLKKSKQVADRPHAFASGEYSCATEKRGPTNSSALRILQTQP